MKAALILLVTLAGCVEPVPDPPVITCTPEQRDRAQQEALREVQIRKLWSSFSRDQVYQEALARNCVAKP